MADNDVVKQTYTNKNLFHCTCLLRLESPTLQLQRVSSYLEHASRALLCIQISRRSCYNALLAI